MISIAVHANGTSDACIIFVSAEKYGTNVLCIDQIPKYIKLPGNQRKKAMLKRRKPKLTKKQAVKRS